MIKYENINFLNHAYVMNAFIEIINSLHYLSKVKTKRNLCDVFQYTDIWEVNGHEFSQWDL